MGLIEALEVSVSEFDSAYRTHPGSPSGEPPVSHKARIRQATLPRLSARLPAAVPAHGGNESRITRSDWLSFNYMRKLGTCIVTILGAILVAIPLSAQAPKQVSGAAAFLSRVAGVYKRQFENGLINGEKYQSEDILEVVPVDDKAAYVRMDLEFFNGHSGRIYGIANYSGKNSLIYDNGKSGDEACAVEYVWSADKVVTRANYEKTPGCWRYHGARGTLDGMEFLVRKKQTIGYMQRLKDSQEFKAAMEEYRRKGHR